MGTSSTRLCVDCLKNFEVDSMVPVKETREPGRRPRYRCKACRANYRSPNYSARSRRYGRYRETGHDPGTD